MSRDEHYGAAKRHERLRDRWIDANDGCRCQPAPTTLRWGRYCRECGKPVPTLTPYGDLK